MKSTSPNNLKPVKAVMRSLFVITLALSLLTCFSFQAAWAGPAAEAAAVEAAEAEANAAQANAVQAMGVEANAADTSLRASDVELPVLDSGINTSAVAEINSKSEIIYALLASDGAIDDAFVVNHFSVAAEGSFSDFGAYEKVNNLTNTEPLTLSGNEVKLASAAGEFYYQGTLLEPQLPWQISFDYTLDGKSIAKDKIAALGGQSGRLGITIATSATPGIDSSFYDYYTLQISLTLPTQNISNISAEGAIIVAAGSNTQVNYTVLPATDETYDFAVDFDAINMPGISIAAVPFGMSFDLPDTGSISDDLRTLANAISELYSGTLQLSSGAAEAADGLEQLAEGSAELESGLAQLNAGTGDISTNSAMLSSSLATIAGGLQMMSDSGLFAYLPPGYGDQVMEAVDALSSVAGGYLMLDEGLQQYTTGVESIAENYGELNEGIGEAACGIRELSDGTASLSSGASQLSNGVQSMPEEMQERIDEFAADFDFSGFEPHSFISTKNNKVVLVQFVITTPAIELPDEIEQIQDTVKESSILDRFLALFTNE